MSRRSKTAKPKPERPSWWGPDWKGLPLACSLTMLLSALLGGLATWLMLRDDPTMFGPTARVSVRGASNGEYLCAIVAGLCTVPGLVLWRRALRQRRLWRNW